MLIFGASLNIRRHITISPESTWSLHATSPRCVSCPAHAVHHVTLGWDGVMLCCVVLCCRPVCHRVVVCVVLRCVAFCCVVRAYPSSLCCEDVLYFVLWRVGSGRVVVWCVVWCCVSCWCVRSHEEQDHSKSVLNCRHTLLFAVHCVRMRRCPSTQAQHNTKQHNTAPGRAGGVRKWHHCAQRPWSCWPYYVQHTFFPLSQEPHSPLLKRTDASGGASFVIRVDASVAINHQVCAMLASPSLLHVGPLVYPRKHVSSSGRATSPLRGRTVTRTNVFAGRPLNCA